MYSELLQGGVWRITKALPNLRVFSKESFTDAGVSYNTYLLSTQDGFVSLGAMPGRFGSEWLEEIRALAGDALKWAVFFGTDDDRAGAQAILEAYPNVTIITSANGLYRMEGFVAGEFGKIEIRTNRTLSLGGRTLSCRILQDKGATPCLYVVDGESRSLFTADVFGALHACEDGESLKAGVERYLEDISARDRAGVVALAAALVRECAVERICPARGGVMEGDLEEILALYSPVPLHKGEKKVVAVVYAPGGYVSELAEAIAQGLADDGNIQVNTYDLSAVSRSDVLRELPYADAYLFGTAQPHGDAAKGVWDILTSLRGKDCKGKSAAVFTAAESLTGAEGKLRGRMEQLGFDLSSRDFVLQGKPDDGGLKNAFDFGFGFGCLVRRVPNPRKPVLVKCLVCGEVFDASLGICPVCGVGLDQCVGADEGEVTFRKDTDRNYLIIGGGTAAVSAADAIRSRDKTGRITLLSAEVEAPINRPMLTKNLESVFQDPQSLALHEDKWYEERDITLKTGVSALSIDVNTKTVTAGDGECYPYDKLIYAAGAECFIPPFEGWDKPGVLTIRHLSDSRKLQEYLKTAKQAVVIGGGVLGLEAASELMRAGVKVTVLEATPQIVGRQIDAASAACLKAAMEGLGVACHEGVSIAAIEGEGHASGVRLADGRVFPADFVLVSCGNKGNVQLAKDAGVACERFITVSRYMETSVPDIYACGDCCQVDGVNYQLWQEASEQGRAAGANAVGERVRYDNRPLGLSLEGFGTTLFAMGDPGKREGVKYKTVETTDQVRARVERYWFFGESLAGAVLIGAPEKTGDISRAVTEHARYSELF